MKRAALSLATTIGAFLAVAPATAWAEGETVVTYTGSPESGSQISVNAAPGKANAVLWEVTDRCDGTLTRVCIRDTAAGIVESPDTPNCNQVSATQVNCLTEGLSSMSIFSGDLGDVVGVVIRDTTGPVVTVPALVNTGTGNDRANVSLTDPSGNTGGSGSDTAVRTGPGSDTVTARFTTNEPANSEILLPNYALGPGPDTARISGPASASGQGGRDKLLGGKGNQKFSGGPQKDRIACGKGNKDRANGGGADDQIADTCERVANP